MKKKSFSNLLHETKLFFDGLNHVSKLFSSLLFWIISLMMVLIIVLGFVSISQLMDANANMEWERHCIFIADGFLAFGIIYFIFALCTMSELVVVGVRELEDFITNIHLNTNPAQQQIMICNSLSKFRGFDANGYFTLNHSMLTGMIASIVTYLVILVQFRQSGV